MTTSPAANALATISILWPHLDDALDQHGTNWLTSKADLFAILDQADAEEASEHHRQRLIRTVHATGAPWYECVECDHVGDGHGHATSEERDPQQLGETRAPLSIRALDTARLVETNLIHLADTIAPQITRPAAAHAPADWAARGWTLADCDQRNTLADQEQADPRRWRYTGRRTAEYAAGWLYARVHGVEGPFRPLTAAQLHHVEHVAEGCAQRIQTTLDLLHHDRPAARPCPLCQGRILITTGAGRTPSARCQDCARGWTLAEPVAA
ncbi:hypothetical protein [Streptomyces xanthophaeus]|uniref:hypothetical protein n=1 Tax=Streptomyces xanthophaeus TaxID=67385 RepID=UPI003667358A